MMPWQLPCPAPPALPCHAPAPAPPCPPSPLEEVHQRPALPSVAVHQRGGHLCPLQGVQEHVVQEAAVRRQHAGVERRAAGDQLGGVVADYFLQGDK